MTSSALWATQYKCMYKCILLYTSDLYVSCTLLYIFYSSIKIRENKLEENNCEYLPDHEEDKNFPNAKVTEEIKGKE